MIQLVFGSGSLKNKIRKIKLKWDKNDMKLHRRDLRQTLLFALWLIKMLCFPIQQTEATLFQGRERNINHKRAFHAQSLISKWGLIREHTLSLRIPAMQWEAKSPLIDSPSYPPHLALCVLYTAWLCSCEEEDHGGGVLKQRPPLGYNWPKEWTTPASRVEASRKL